jgi:sterol desaturase/sphingolipid hydroxylase (fatty acid hydroxylase superfamily)
MFNNHSKHTTFVSILIILIFVIAGGLFVSATHAQEYQLLAPLPGGGATVPVEEGFSTYMSQLFWFLLSGAVILALVMLIVGGVEYVASAGNVSLLGDAKGRIINALVGLVLALAAWVTLNLINPDLVDFSVVIPEVSATITHNP